MWKKEDAPDPIPSPNPSPTPRPEPTPGFERVPPPRAGGERATIGRSITIKGQVSGDEDLLIQGTVEGSVSLKQHAVTVGPEGEIKADITGRVITIEGRVEGNLDAQEQIILRGSAIVEGNITAPRVVLEDGARFRGGVDMGETPKATGRGGTRSAGTTPADPGRPGSAAARGTSEPEAVGKPEAAPAKDAALTATRA